MFPPATLGTVLSGIGVSSGVVLGNAHVLSAESIQVEHVRIPEPLIEAEVRRLHAAVERAVEEIDELHRGLTESGMAEGEHQGLLDAHIMMLRDPMLVAKTERRIRRDKLNVEWALSLAIDKLTQIFAGMEDPFFRERGADVAHVGELLQRSLAGGRNALPVGDIQPGQVIVAKQLSPADALTLARMKVAGFVLDTGTPTSHTSIIARSLGIPAVVGLKNASDHVADGDRIILDGGEGEVIVHPSQEEETVYERRARRARVLARTLSQNQDEPAVTLDGHKLILRANLELVEEAPHLREHGARGVGLYRTEFLFIDRPTRPSEEEQFEAYSSVLGAFAPDPVVIRTLDVGGDKVLPVAQLSTQISPGLRAVRYCLSDVDLFRTQLRALLRASVHGNLRLLVPFISGVSEVRSVKRHIEAVRQELTGEGVPVPDHVPIGFMVEIPSAAIVADLIAREADFLAVGSNDLIQYMLAISRDDEALEYLYHPLHPALLRVLTNITRAAASAGIPVSCCGEMAAEPRYALVLLALGFNELSMSARSIPLVKEIVRRSTRSQAQALLHQILRYDTAAEINDVVDSYMVEHFSDIVIPKMRLAPHYMR